jgi:hypothetical protein
MSPPLVYLATLFLVLHVAWSVKYDGYHVFSISPFEDDTNLNFIKSLIDQDERAKKVIPLGIVSKKLKITLAVAPSETQRIQTILEERKLSYKILDTDLQKSYDEMMEHNQMKLDKFKANPEQFAHDAYLKYYKEQLKFLQEIADRYPTTTSITRIGKTSLETSENFMNIFSINPNSDSLPSIWIEANIRAREWLTSATALYIIDQIVSGTSSDAQYLRNNFRFHVNFNANPDGYDYTFDSDRHWIKNRVLVQGYACRGVDLNRNYDSDFAGGGLPDASPCSNTFCGVRAFSELETANVRNFSLTIRSSCNVFISLQAYGQFIILPWTSGVTPPTDFEELKRVADLAAAAAGAVNGLPFQVGTHSDLLGYTIAGSSTDWSKAKNRMAYSYIIALRPDLSVSTGYIVPPSNIVPSGQETLAAIAVIAREAQHKPPIA